MNPLPANPDPVRSGRSPVLVLATLLALAGLGYTGWRLRQTGMADEAPAVDAPVYERMRCTPYEKLSLWWGQVPDNVRAEAPADGYSNIEPADYVGPKTCAACHEKEYKQWERHPHRFMNVAATPAHVVGDFGGARFSYLGGEGRFWREGDTFFMAAERGSVRRTWKISRTIGSRYFQYYVGVQTAGPEPGDNLLYTTDHVLPFGYWLTKKRWVPTVHIRDDRKADYDDPQLNPYDDFYFCDYDRNCSSCHATLPWGDWLLRNPGEAGHFSPYRVSFDLTGYLRRQHPELLDRPPEQVSDREFSRLVVDLVENRPPARLAHLGIVCEACHNGGKKHADDPEHVSPRFFASSPLVAGRPPGREPYGRTKENVNFICARCHNGHRPQYPGGFSTWNSVEYTDAMNGSCYSRLRCIDCHEPHTPTGPAWTRTPAQDDAVCLKCHTAYQDAVARKGHTHHAPGSDGDRCLNCHMPRINEGMDQVVRTHTIYSPTKREPIEQNGPNACNLCHLDKPIDWTLTHLRSWYGRAYDEGAIAQNYPGRQAPVGHGWLKHTFEATRLAAAGAYARAGDRGILPVLVDILDDRFLLNRQFGQLAVEKLSGTDLAGLGYSFTLAPEERQAILPRVRAAVTKDVTTEAQRTQRVHREKR